MDLTGLVVLLGIAVTMLLGLMFQRPLRALWAAVKGDFDHQQSLQRLAATNKHGHFYLTIEKCDREMEPVAEISSSDGSVVYTWDGTEFNNREAADFARHSAVLAAAKAFYGDIDTWTMSLPAPKPRWRGRR